ncbi:hypothetical protein LTR15_001806 [Elasticomyces elasticus]|nr:hypothetical protein LTR15_001806 [Elasticomyces elasticus]
MQNFIALPEDTRDHQHVQCVLYWTGTAYERVIVRFVERDRILGQTPEDSSVEGRWLGCIGYIIVDVADVTQPTQENYVQLVSSWMEECRNHTSCKTLEEAWWIPTRLLCVTDMELEFLPSDQVPMGSSYITLSHRWTDAINDVKLMSDDIPKTFHIPRMPRAFQAAAKLARSLGINYLWIDCLCIKQHDSDDWKIQSELMDKVYRYAACNIAATGASEGEDRLLPAPDRHKDSELFRNRFNCSWNSESSDITKEYYLVRSTAWPWDVEVENAEINRRGWVFQERLLSPKIIHFGQHRVFWECRQALSFSAITNDGHMLEVKTRKGRTTWRNPKEWAEVVKEVNARFVLGQSNLNELYKQWVLLRTAYVDTTVTYAKDRLVALSGIVKAFEQLLGEEDIFFQGLWCRTLIYDLLWSVRKPTERSTQEVPSWSRASMENGDIHFMAELSRYPHDSHELAKVSLVANTAGTQAIQSSSRQLRIQGYLIPFNPTNEISMEFWEHLLQNYEVPWDPEATEVTLCDKMVRFDEIWRHEDKSSYILLPLLLTNLMVSEGSFRLSGLIIKPDGNHTNQFERRGYFECLMPKAQLFYWY